MSFPAAGRAACRDEYGYDVVNRAMGYGAVCGVVVADLAGLPLLAAGAVFMTPLGAFFGLLLGLLNAGPLVFVRRHWPTRRASRICAAITSSLGGFAMFFLLSQRALPIPALIVGFI